MLQNIRSTIPRAKNEIVNYKNNYSKKHTSERMQAATDNRCDVSYESSSKVLTDHQHPHPPQTSPHTSEQQIQQILLAPDLSTPYLNDKHNVVNTAITKDKRIDILIHTM